MSAMQDFWLAAGMVIVAVLIVACVATVCVFFYKVWKHVNKPSGIIEDCTLVNCTLAGGTVRNCRIVQGIPGEVKDE